MPSTSHVKAVSDMQYRIFIKHVIVLTQMKYSFLDFCNTPNWDVQSEGHRVMAHQFEGKIHTTFSGK